ncbi:PPOX class F420-dependent oxidoreductase [Halorarius litoreus]|uniref:PPOX class F420-dependent oxidoreductase n=1 Tax=Halorarius litoreus TaxID=2962676 RepID=UPI0020CFC80B|nr:PPOX class F420-dependent oxidoreductase [Halorarius litoreus]
MAEIPAEFHDLFDMKTFAHFSTVMPDGTPQTTPVWIDHDSAANRVLVNTARGRQKEQNVRENPKVGLSMTAPDDPYRFLSVRGTVDEVTEDGAVEHIDTLAARYMGVDEYPNHGDEDGARVLIKIPPEHVSHS